jgi:hypothetical protein
VATCNVDMRLAEETSPALRRTEQPTEAMAEAIVPLAPAKAIVGLQCRQAAVRRRSRGRGIAGQGMYVSVRRRHQVPGSGGLRNCWDGRLSAVCHQDYRCSRKDGLQYLPPQSSPL